MKKLEFAEKFAKKIYEKGRKVLGRSIAVLAFAACLCAADMIISANALPENIKTFISAHFKAQIGLVQMDRKSYEIYLTDGTELEFDLMGNWIEIENKRTFIDLAVLPPNLALIIKAQHPNTPLIEVKRKINYYKVKLANRMKIYIDPNGTILMQKFD